MEENTVMPEVKMTEMQTKNFNYLKDVVLPNLEFDHRIIQGALRTNILLDREEFDIKVKGTKNDLSFNHELNFEMIAIKDKQTGEDVGRYFLNNIKTTLSQPNEPDRSHTFQLYRQSGFTKSEQQNLLEGLAVKVSYTSKKTGKDVTEWKKLDLNKKDEQGNPIKDEKGNYIMMSLPDKLNIVLELSKLPVIYANPEDKEKLIKSLETGNKAEFTARLDNKNYTFKIAADPENSRLNVYDSKGERININTDRTLQLIEEKAQQNGVSTGTNVVGSEIKPGISKENAGSVEIKPRVIIEDKTGKNLNEKGNDSSAISKAADLTNEIKNKNDNPKAQGGRKLK